MNQASYDAPPEADRAVIDSYAGRAMSDWVASVVDRVDGEIQEAFRADGKVTFIDQPRLADVAFEAAKILPVIPNPVLFARSAGSQVAHNAAGFSKPMRSLMWPAMPSRMTARSAIGKATPANSCPEKPSPEPAALGLGGSQPMKSLTRPSCNGIVVQDTELSLLIKSIPRLIAYCSTILPLLLGDVIVAVEISQIGTLRNEICHKG